MSLRAGRIKQGLQHSSGLFILIHFSIHQGACPRFAGWVGTTPWAAGPGWAGVKQARYFPEERDSSHRIAQSSPHGTLSASTPSPTPSRQNGDSKPPSFTAGRDPAFVTCCIQGKYLDGTFPGQVAHPQQGLQDTEVQPVPSLPTPFADAAPGKVAQGHSSTSPHQDQAPGTAPSSLQKPQSAKELKQPHC